jgi:hypothetical protein
MTIGCAPEKYLYFFSSFLSAPLARKMITAVRKLQAAGL